MSVGRHLVLRQLVGLVLRQHVGVGYFGSGFPTPLEAMKALSCVLCLSLKELSLSRT